MAWTTPRTWAASEVPTADGALGFNQQIRDNLNVLKGPFDANAKLAALDSARVAELDGTQIEHVVRLAKDNGYSSGRQDFNAGGGTRVVVPVGRNLFAGGLRHRRGRGRWVAMASKDPGSTWVRGDYWHFVDDQKVERRYAGDAAGMHTDAAASPGSIWQDTDDLGHFISEAGGVERFVASVTTGMHSDAAASPGSPWVDVDGHVHSIGTGGQERDWHTDAPPHNDAHSDVAHSDSHTDVAHSDSHTDSHFDAGHGDSHSDAHTDSHSDAAHQDAAHSDSHGDVCLDPPECFMHTDSHSDAAHVDSAHSDSHSDVGHSDSHTDSAHSDSHSDVGHSDVGHSDSHSDAHTDSHQDHSDVHGDQPEIVGLKNL